MRLEPAPPKDLRIPVVALALAAAILLGAAAFSKSWVANAALGDIGFGPTGFRGCLMHRECDLKSNSDVVAWFKDPENKYAIMYARSRIRGETLEAKASGAFAPMGWATFATCLLAAVCLVVGAVLAYQRKRPDLPFSPASIALLSLMLALIFGCVFIATKPGWPGMVGVEWGFWIFGIGCVAGIVAAQMIAKLIRPVDPDLLDDSMNPGDFPA